MCDAGAGRQCGVQRDGQVRVHGGRGRGAGGGGARQGAARTYLDLVYRVSMIISTGRPGDHQEEGVQVGGDDGLLGHLHDEVRILDIMYTW